MRKLLILLLLCLSVSVHATTYYISPSGSDSNSGTSSSPWKTLSYACTKATSSGDIIHVNAGTYALTSSVSIPTGVSIEGDGLTSLITSSVTGSGSGAAAWTLKLSSSMGTNGNQHISNIKMDGQNLAAWGGIGINGRSNVKIYNCTFVNFLEVAVTFNGQAGYTEGAPGTFGTGNELHDCTVTNCAGYRGSNDYGAGNIMIGGQSGLLIYNNTIVQTARTGNVNGYLIKYYSGGYNKGIKIYNNYLETAPRAGTQATSSWGFVLEQWNPIGGWEIYGNTIKGCLDLVNVSKGSYAASFDIHDNTLGFDATPATGTTQGDVCIRLEAYFQSVNIYRNHFKNTVACVYASGENGNATSGLNMYSNIFDNIGGDNNTGWVFRYTNDGSTYTISNLNFWNNVMIAGSAHSTNYGITIPFGSVSNVSIRNNIIEGFDQGPVQLGASGSGSNVSIENNIFYSNGSSNAPAGSISYSSYTNQNNLKVDPQFASSSDYHLQSSSPAIGKGLNVGLTTDYAGNAANNPPSIGAYESGSAVSVPAVPIYQSSVVGNTTPAVIQLSYNMSLASIVPPVSAFNVQVNSVARSVNAVTIAGSAVQLTLAAAIVYGDVVSVSYTTPASNQLQTAAGGQAASINTKTVTNNVAAVVPVYVSSAVANATPSLLEMTYNLALANVVPEASSFSVLVNSINTAVKTVVISGTKAQLTLSGPIVYGDVVTVSYTKPSSNPLQTTAGGQAATISTKTVTNNVAAVIPGYVSSVVANATPSLLEMTYNLTLANVVPEASSFSVLINSVSTTVNSVTISGTKVQLTLTSPVVYDDVVTVSYVRPATNSLQTTAGGQASTIGAQTVTNNVAAIIPVYVSSVVANATPSLLEMTYNLTLANVVPEASSFSVLINSVNTTANSVVISGTKVQLTLASPVVYGDVVTVSYARPATNSLQTTAGGQASTIGAQTVTNNVAAVIPVYVSSAVANATPSLLEMTYNLTLANVVPEASSFSVLINSVSRTVNTVAISETKVQLTLTSPVVYGDVVTVSYARPATNSLQTTAGGQASTITYKSVTNNCSNSAPSVVITSPVINNSFTAYSNIAITASAFDTDGLISVVEFYSGTTKLGSITSAPYSYTWNNVPPGSYSLTAVATDNMNSKTTSAVVPISVNNRASSPNRHPIVRISNPRKGNSYDNLSTIEIDATASDPDGTISKVEFYNGDIKLVELASAPYTFTWKDVSAGTYSITAIATDNLNDTTVSSPIEFVVGEKIKYDANSDMINLYPNPNNGQFAIEFLTPLQTEKSEIVITDLSGKQIYDGPVLKEEITKQFDLSGSKAGIYIMMIKDKNIIVTKKFIKNS